VRDTSQLAEIEKLIKSPYLKDESKANTFESRLHFYDAHCFYAYVMGDYRKAFVNSKKSLQHFKNNPEKIPHNIIPFLGYTNNLIETALLSKLYSEIPGFIHEMEKLVSVTKNKLISARLFYFINNNYLTLYNRTGDFDAATQLISENKSELTVHEKTLLDSEKVILFSNIAISYFGRSEFKNSIYWLNRIRNEVIMQVHLDIESFLRLFYIIVHYEAGNDELLPSLIQSAYRFLRKKGRLYTFEKFIIDFLRKQQIADSKQKLIMAFKKLKSELKPLEKDKYERNAFEYFDYISWLESKIENKPFAEIVREKAKSTG